MGSKANYLAILEDKARLEERINSLVLSRLAYLQQVGKSVLNKKFGGSTRGEDLTFLGDIGLWLQHGGFKLESLAEETISLSNSSLTSQRPKGIISIPRELIHTSDREFAKQLRGKIYARKAYKRKVELDQAERTMKSIQEEISQKTQELKRLEKLVTEAKAREEKKD